MGSEMAAMRSQGELLALSHFLDLGSRLEVDTMVTVLKEGDQAYCGHCGRPLSASGKEIGLLIYDKEKGKWVVVCASERCSGIPEDIMVLDLQNYWLNKEMLSARLMSGTDRSLCLFNGGTVGVHDPACDNKSIPFRLDDIRIPVVWRIIATAEDVCGVCQYYESFRICIEDALKNGDLPADAVILEEIT